MKLRCCMLLLLCLLLTAPALAEEEYDLADANAAAPLTLTNCYSTDQNVHPKVLYFENGFGGHAYWMAYTPYTWANSAQENPCIAYSDDGYRWTNIPGNPIDMPDKTINGYFSDTHLVYREDTGLLECWYRLADRAVKREVIYRKVSKDGIHWSDRELLHDTGPVRSQMYCLSPAVIWDGEQYCIWYVFSRSDAPGADGQYIVYCTSRDGKNWIEQHTIRLDYVDDHKLAYRLWHIDVMLDEGTYVITAMAKGGPKSQDNTGKQAWSLFVTTSQDNIEYTEPQLILRGSKGWDRFMYRSSMVRVGNEYRLYYSAVDSHKAYRMGITVSDGWTEFMGVK